MRKIASALVLCVILLTLNACVITRESIIIKENFSGTNCEIDFFEWSEQNKCELFLDEGDELLVDIACESGSIALDIQNKKGYEAYSGNGLQTSRFTVKVNETGEYKIAIKGENATGHIEVKNLSK